MSLWPAQHRLLSEPPANTESVGELWLGLLRFYTEEFDFKEHVISIRQRKRLTTFEKQWTSKCIAIEGPHHLQVLLWACSHWLARRFWQLLASRSSSEALIGSQASCQRVREARRFILRRYVRPQCRTKGRLSFTMRLDDTWIQTIVKVIATREVLTTMLRSPC